MLKSEANMPACKLLRFATGLPKLDWSRFITPSLRFRGLDLTGGCKTLAPGTPDSLFGFMRSRKSNLIGPSLSSKRNGDGFETDSGSGSSDSFGGVISFSSPELRREEDGVELPVFVDSPKARLLGLLGDWRVRGDERTTVAERLSWSFDFLVEVCGPSRAGDGGLRSSGSPTERGRGFIVRGTASGERGECAGFAGDR